MAGSIEMKPIKEVEQPEKEEKDLVVDARRVAVELGQERKSALCKAVTHKVVEAKAEQMIYALCREVERLKSTSPSDTEELLALREAAEVAHKFLLDIGYDKEMAVCAKLGKALGK